MIESNHFHTIDLKMAFFRKAILVIAVFGYGILASQAQDSFTYRGYLGWMADFSQQPVYDRWPSVKLDSGILADYLETVDFLKRSGMNSITPWGFFTNDNWNPEIEKTISPERKGLVEKIIKLTHQRGIKVMCGMGIYSWGFGEIIKQNPGLVCPCNQYVMDFNIPEAWEWQKKVLDYVMDNFDFDGFSLQSADRGSCNCDAPGYISTMKYQALLNQKVVNYIRRKRPDYIIGICGWGMNVSGPEAMPMVVEMTRHVDYFIDVCETADFTPGYQKELIKAIAPCAYGNTATPNIEPIQSIQRDSYFVPTVFATCERLKRIYHFGGRACEAYARTRGNPGDKVTIEVVARILRNPGMKINNALTEAVKEIYLPENHKATVTLAKVFKTAENAFFENIPPLVSGKQYSNVILLMRRSNKSTSLEYFSRMDSAALNNYIGTLKDLEVTLENISNSINNKNELRLLSSSIENMITELESQSKLKK